MNYIDIIIVVVVGLFVLNGVRKGLVKMLANIIGLVAGIIVATGLMKPAAELLMRIINMNTGIAFIVSFAALFIGIVLLFKVIAGLIQKLFEVTSTRWIDRAGGGVFGFLIGGLIISMVFMALSFFSFTDSLLPQREKSLLYPYTRDFSPAIYNLFSKVRPKADSFQDIISDIFKDLPLDKLLKTEAGRNFRNYTDKLKN